MIAALFVETNGVYYGIADVDPWDEQRDARLYPGPYPVVAHPPCERWGRYWHGGPSARERKIKGDDGGCFAAALQAVRTYGGVLEHPAHSHAWVAHKLPWPPREGWQKDIDDGWCCEIEQAWFGHKARKKTWLYACHIDPPTMPWGKAPGKFRRLDQGYHSAEERARDRRTGICQRLSARQRKETPVEFRDFLLFLACSAMGRSIGKQLVDKTRDLRSSQCS